MGTLGSGSISDPGHTHSAPQPKYLYRLPDGSLRQLTPDEFQLEWDRQTNAPPVIRVRVVADPPQSAEQKRQAEIDHIWKQIVASATGS